MQRPPPLASLRQRARGFVTRGKHAATSHGGSCPGMQAAVSHKRPPFGAKGGKGTGESSMTESFGGVLCRLGEATEHGGGRKGYEVASRGTAAGGGAACCAGGGGAGGAAARRATRAAPGHSARAPWPPSRARRPRPWRPGSACRARAGVCGGRGRGWGRGEEALPPRARRQARHSAAPPPRCCFSICSQSLVAAGYPAGYAFFVLICSSRSFRLPRSPRWLAWNGRAWCACVEGRAYAWPKAHRSCIP